MSQQENYKGRKGAFAAESTLRIQPPDTRHATISRMDFAVMKDGEVNKPEAKRDMCIGVAATAIFALIGFIQAVDWDATIRAGAKMPFLWAGIQAVALLACTLLAFFFNSQVSATRNTSAYALLTQRLEDYFSGIPEGAIVAPKMPLCITKALYGVDGAWKTVTEILQDRITDSVLTIQASNEELGPDPAPNVRKTLRVTYMLGNSAYNKEVQEDEILSIP